MSHHHIPTERFRTLALADVENLLGDHRFDHHASWPAVLAPLLTSSARRHVVIATGPRLALGAHLAYPAARQLIGRGVNGADLALLNSVNDLDHVASRYQRLEIMSGDGIFTARAVAARHCGLEVTVTSRPEALAAELRRAASSVCELSVANALETVA